MSGFVALLHADGRPVDPRDFAAPAAAMAYRGPDGTTTRIVDGAAFGHAAFRTVEEPAEAPQPLDLEERLWVIADARLDDRARLIADLAAAGRAGLQGRPDAELLLHAYDAWGEAMVERLLGDFAFVIWDARARRALCARDHMGVKPFYYALVGDDLLCGNTLPSLRAHPAVGDALDPHAICDYLLFGLNRHAERTSFADIRRLPPAHTLRWRPGSAPRSARYWRLHVEEPLDLTDERAIEERFDALLRAAVADRLRGPRAAVSMSGGLDSTAVAALAREEMRARYETFELNALTFAFEEQPQDPEPAFAAEVAAALDMPLHTVALDHEAGALLGDDGAAWSAEPTDLPASRRTIERVSAAMPGMRVALTGQGGDPLLHVTPADAAHRVGRDGIVTTAADMLRYRVASGHLPRTGLRTHLKRRLRGRRFETPQLFPPWLRADLVERLDLRARHAAFVERALDASALRPEAEFQLAGGEWSYFLEWYDPGMSGFAAEYRHPLLDVRLLEFGLALPVMPWLVEKEILRRAMRHRLPAAILRRRKAALAANPVHDKLIVNGEGRLGLAADAAILAEFIDVERFVQIAADPRRLRPWEYELVTRPLGLALWLSRLHTGKPGVTEMAGDGGKEHAQKALP